jgi:outer membrane protein assembly factor BamB
MGTQYVGCVNDTGIVWESLCNRSIDDPEISQAILPPTAVIHNNGLIWVGARDHVLCFDSDDGNLLAKLEAPNQYGAAMATPSIGEGYITFMGPGIAPPFIESSSTNKFMSVYDIDNN